MDNWKAAMQKLPYLTIAYIICCIIHLANEPMGWLVLGFSYGIFLPLNLAQLIAAIVHYYRYRELYWWRSPYMLIYIAVGLLFQIGGSHIA